MLSTVWQSWTWPQFTSLDLVRDAFEFGLPPILDMVGDRAPAISGAAAHALVVHLITSGCPVPGPMEPLTA